MTELLKFSSTCNRNAVPLMDHPQIIYLFTEIEPEAAISSHRLPLNFSLILDRSGSMSGDKLRMVKEAVKTIIDQLKQDDILSIVTFETRAEVVASAHPVNDKNGLKSLVDKIREGGGTNIALALKVALRMVSQHASEKRASRVVLLTDGEATDREQDSFRAADEAGALGIPIIGLGFGKDWNEEFLFQLADRSIQTNPGSHTGYAEYIPDPGQVGKIFQDVFQSMQVVAQDVLATIRMVQGLEVRKLWQVVPLIRELGLDVVQDRSIQFPIAQLERAGAAFLIEVMIPSRPEGKVRIAQADISISTPGHGPMRQSTDIIIEYTNDATQAEQFNSRVMNVVDKVQAFKLQTQALEDAQSGDIETATRKLRQAVTILLSQGEIEIAQQMNNEADRLVQDGVVSSEGKKTIMLTSRKTVRLSE